MIGINQERVEQDAHQAFVPAKKVVAKKAPAKRAVAQEVPAKKVVTLAMAFLTYTCNTMRNGENEMTLPHVCLSVRDMSPISRIPKDHFLVILKSYFDGASESDAFRSITITTACGTSEKWEAFEVAWRNVLNRHGVQYLHTTDAVALGGEFSQK
jgi:hypothetical protein